MAETLARLEDVKKENATLRSENEYLRAQLAQWDPNFHLKLDLPDAEQGLLIWKKITSKYPRMISPTDSVTDQVQGLVAAMAFVFTCKKTETMTSRYDGSWWLSKATAFANDARMSAPRIRSVLIGIIATNDVPYILSNSDIFLDVYSHGEPIDRHAWRRLLSGPVGAPTALRPKVDDRSIGHVRQASAW
jgi:hypothetical protein